MEKDGEDNRKARKDGQVVSQVSTPRLDQDKIQAQWALDILLKSMLERVRWCKCFKMES
jgi:hypothetical protein